MIGALAWFIKKSFDDFKLSIKQVDEKLDKSITALDKKITECDEKHTEKYESLQKSLNSLEKDLPLVYTLREDFLRVMNGVDDKLAKLLYGRNGGNNND